MPDSPRVRDWARARFVSLEEEEAVALGEGVEDDEVEVDLLLAVAVGGFEGEGAHVLHADLVDD